ncbi:MAG: HlyC/CorC family transporter [Sedimentisphaerales bacterium]|nr:HlyC/CorC family transporter [Sedimentisphaerales bacterium]
MGSFLENFWHLISMAVLLACSAFLSGSETAFFNISRRQIQLFRNSTHKLHNLAACLLETPRQLLTSLLFGNMVVNVLYFTLSSVYSVKVKTAFGPLQAVITAGVAFFVLLLAGEMLPKSIAYLHSRSFCIAAGPFCYVCMRILSPLLKVLEFIIVTPTLRLLTGTPDKTQPVSPIQFKTLIESTRQRGLITEDQNQVFSEVIELGLLKIRHVMKPRVDMVACNVSDPTNKIKKMMIENNLTKIPAYKGTIDNIVGLLHQRDIILSADRQSAKLVKEVNFVPEQKSVESLLGFFQKTSTDMAIVVDEYGGIAGSVSLEDIVEELLGPIEQKDSIEPIEQIGPMEYRLAADLAIHDWAQAFDINPEQDRLCTIGGLATALLGKIPCASDTVKLKNLRLTVEKVHKHRIQSLILSLEPETKNNKEQT